MAEATGHERDRAAIPADDPTTAPAADRSAPDSAGAAGHADRIAAALAPLRARIDAIDHEIVALLNERAEIALEIGHLKQATGRRAIRDASREQEVIERVTSASAGLFPEPELVALYRKLIAATRKVQAVERRSRRVGGGGNAPESGGGPSEAAVRRDRGA